MATYNQGVVNKDCAVLGGKFKARHGRSAQDTFVQESRVAKAGSVVPAEGVMSFFLPDGTIASNIAGRNPTSLFGIQTRYVGSFEQSQAMVDATIRGLSYVFNTGAIDIKAGQTVGYSKYADNTPGFYNSNFVPGPNAKVALILPAGAERVEELVTQMINATGITSFATIDAHITAGDGAAANAIAPGNPAGGIGGGGGNIADTVTNTLLLFSNNFNRDIVAASEMANTVFQRCAHAQSAFRHSTNLAQEKIATTVYSKLLQECLRDTFVEIGVARDNIPSGTGGIVELFRH